jgi:hypothetical protein
MSEGNWLFLFTSAGGLGDVVGFLPKALSCHSHNITVTAILCQHPRQKGLVQIECQEYIAKKNTTSQSCSSEADNPVTWSSSDNQNCVLHIVWRVESTACILKAKYTYMLSKFWDFILNQMILQCTIWTLKRNGKIVGTIVLLHENLDIFLASLTVFRGAGGGSSVHQLCWCLGNWHSEDIQCFRTGIRISAISASHGHADASTPMCF